MAEEVTPEHSMLDRQRAQSWRGWMRRNRSPLARKIIIFNVFGLLVLVFGILYLNQNDNTAVEQSRKLLNSEARVIALALEPFEGDAVAPRFAELAAESEANAVLYGPTGDILRYVAVPNDADAELDPTGGSALMRGLQSVWGALAAIGLESSDSDRGNPLSKFSELATRAMQTGVAMQETLVDTDGQIYVVVAAPVDGRFAVVLATRRGEIDARIRAARERILEMFVLAILCSIILSVLLANSIARPLRQLVNATDVGSGRINPARIRIPDMSSRPDEVGDLSRALQSMTGALYQRIEENKLFAADVAHELKNPLTSLRSAVETLDYVKSDADRSELLDIIRVDIDRMNRLVTDISNASRLEAELVRDTWAEVKLDEMLANLLRHHELQADAAGVTLEMHSKGQDMAIRGLESRLAQVFANVIGNALSFVPRGGQIDIAMNGEGEDRVTVLIADTGPGIPVENLNDIFSRFYSSRPDETFGDHSGLGLAISRQIVEAHGGTITASNRTDGQTGAVFTIVLSR